MLGGGVKVMVFHSKIDRFFRIVLMIVVFIIGLVTIGPLFVEEAITILPSFIMSAIFTLTTSFIAWISFSIKYVFNDEYLLVKGGPFQSKIRYEDLTRVDKTDAILTGYRLLTKIKWNV